MRAIPSARRESPPAQRARARAVVGDSRTQTKHAMVSQSSRGRAPSPGAASHRSGYISRGQRWWRAGPQHGSQAHRLSDMQVLSSFREGPPVLPSSRTSVGAFGTPTVPLSARRSSSSDVPILLPLTVFLVLTREHTQSHQTDRCAGRGTCLARAVVDQRRASLVSQPRRSQHPSQM